MLYTFFILSLVSTSLALNDWSKPCFNDECHWDIPQDTGVQSSGSIRVYTDQPGGISDVTEAAGWMMLDCNPNASSQNIRLVCMGGADQPKCDHLLKDGAENKLVRLPDGCGKGPFAAVSASYIHPDQSLPASMKVKLQKRGGATPTVRGLAIHMDWRSVEISPSGPVNIEVLGFNAPGFNKQTSRNLKKLRKTALAERGIGDFFKNLGKKVVDTAKDVGKKIEDAGKKVVEVAKDVAKDVQKATTVDFNKNSTKSLTANFDKNLVNLTVACGRTNAAAKVDVSSRSNADVTLGILAKGSVIPPKLDDFALFAGLNANLEGKMTILVQATGVVDSGQIRVFELGIPGLDIPGIFSVGPSLQILVQAKANLDVNLDMEVDLAYKVDKAILFFPQSDKHKSETNFAPANSPLKLSAAPNSPSKMSLEAHVIPKVLVGISAFGKVASANIFLQLDASATLGLTLDGSPPATANPPPPAAAAPPPAGVQAPPPPPAQAAAISPPPPAQAVSPAAQPVAATPQSLPPAKGAAQGVAAAAAVGAVAGVAGAAAVLAMHHAAMQKQAAAMAMQPVVNAVVQAPPAMKVPAAVPAAPPLPVAQPQRNNVVAAAAAQARPVMMHHGVNAAAQVQSAAISPAVNAALPAPPPVTGATTVSSSAQAQTQVLNTPKMMHHAANAAVAVPLPPANLAINTAAALPPITPPAGTVSQKMTNTAANVVAQAVAAVARPVVAAPPAQVQVAQKMMHHVVNAVAQPATAQALTSVPSSIAQNSGAQKIMHHAAVQAPAMMHAQRTANIAPAAPAALVRRQLQNPAAALQAAVKAVQPAAAAVPPPVSAAPPAAASALVAGAPQSPAPIAAAPANAARGQVNGCVDLTGGLVVSAGATANFFSFFNEKTSVEFFNKKFRLFQKCFGDKAKREIAFDNAASMYSRPRHLLLSKRASLTCPPILGLVNLPLINQVLSNIPAI